MLKLLLLALTALLGSYLVAVGSSLLLDAALRSDVDAMLAHTIRLLLAAVLIEYDVAALLRLPAKQYEGS